jgi:uncharacterized protein YjbI with pentapeptide repeats
MAENTVGGVAKGTKKTFLNQKFYDEDFSDKDLTHADFRNCTLFNCNFDGSDLTYATFEGANCYKSSFRRTKLYYTNFRNAVLAGTIMHPRDFFGTAITMTCDTFDKMQLSHQYKLVWLYQLLLTESDSLNDKVKTLLIDEIGEDRFKSLERIFRDRQI